MTSYWGIEQNYTYTPVQFIMFIVVECLINGTYHRMWGGGPLLYDHNQLMMI